MRETDDTRRAGLLTRLPRISYGRIVLYLLVLLFCVYYITPLWSALVTSFKTASAIINTKPFAPPSLEGLTMTKWVRAFNFLSRGFVNSFVVAVPATLLTLLFASTSAYGLTFVDWNRRARLIVLLLFVVGIFIPYQPLIVPIADFWSNIFPLETYLALIWSLPLFDPIHAQLVELMITHVAFGIPLNMLLFRSYYKSISRELVEAAKIDGASVTSIYLRIILPLSKPMIAVVLIYQFTAIYNSFLFPLTIIGSSTSPVATVPLVLSGIGVDLTGIDFGLRMAAALLAAFPTIIVYALFTEQFAEGITGA